LTTKDVTKNPVVKGFTTNPTLMKQAGVTDYVGFCKEILSAIPDKPISFEVFADEFNEMARQAREIKSWGKNVYVKIPITNSKGESSIPLIKELSHEKIQLNVTALFTTAQTEATCAAVKGGAPSIISVFAGRIADAGTDPMPIIKTCSDLCRKAGPEVKLLWASCREVFNLVQAEQSGCDIITMTPDQIKKISGFGKDLTQFSLETVQMFKKDAEAAGFKL
jgi:transaldolase